MKPTDKAKTINGLMIHLRDDCNINIGGSKEKFRTEHIRKRELIRSGLNDMDLPFPKH